MSSFLRRWLYLIIGGALVMPFVIVMTVVLRSNPSLLEGVFNADPIIFIASLPLVVIAGFFPQIRTIEAPLARSLLGGPAQGIDPDGTGVRSRVALFWFLHLIVGGAVAGMTLAIPPAAVFLVAEPFLGDVGWPAKPLWIEATGDWSPLLGIALLVLLVATAYGVGALLAWAAPRLLGPSPADQVTALKRTAEQLAQRNQLARELHDSVGHTLSIVMLQASAAAQVFDSNPAFARKALANIEESARTAQAELDHVLGLLRENPRLRYLIEQAQQAGMELDAVITGDEATLPAEVAHELNQIAREGLTNAIRHGGPGTVTLRVTISAQEVSFTLTNPLGRQRTGGGGRGLLGIQERAQAVGGSSFSRVLDEHFHLSATLPLRRKP